MKNQTLDERNIINKGLQIHKYIYNVYKKLRFKCYNHFSEKTSEEKATISYIRKKTKKYLSLLFFCFPSRFYPCIKLFHKNDCVKKTLN